MSTKKKVDPFYYSKRWIRLRRGILERDDWMCQMAKAQGKKVPAVAVHHIFPRSQYPEFQWCEWNLISLSLEAHNMMHRRDSDELSERGELLKQQTAAERGIDTDYKTVLVIGMPHSGKTTYVKKHLGEGVAYDLDYIAAALRLKSAGVEYYKPARLLANLFFSGFSEVAHRYFKKVYIIRTAPTEEQLVDIKPSKLVVCRGGYGNSELTDRRRHSLAKRISEAVVWAERNSVPVEEVENDY